MRTIETKRPLSGDRIQWPLSQFESLWNFKDMFEAKSFGHKVKAQREFSAIWLWKVSSALRVLLGCILLFAIRLMKAQELVELFLINFLATGYTSRTSFHSNSFKVLSSAMKSEARFIKEKARKALQWKQENWVKQLTSVNIESFRCLNARAFMLRATIHCSHIRSLLAQTRVVNFHQTTSSVKNCEIIVYHC